MDNTKILSSLTQARRAENNIEFQAMIRAYRSLSEPDQECIDAQIFFLTDRISGLGTVGAFELIAKLGMRLAWWENPSVRHLLIGEH